MMKMLGAAVAAFALACAAPASAAVVFPERGFSALYKVDNPQPDEDGLFIRAAALHVWGYKAPGATPDDYQIFYMDTELFAGCFGEKCSAATDPAGLSVSIDWDGQATSPAFFRITNRLAPDFNTCDVAEFDGRCFGSFTPTELLFTGSDGAELVSLSAVPEPATWAMLIAGFGLSGAQLRRRRRLHQAAILSAPTS